MFSLRGSIYINFLAQFLPKRNGWASCGGKNLKSRSGFVCFWHIQKTKKLIISPCLENIKSPLPSYNHHSLTTFKESFIESHWHIFSASTEHPHPKKNDLTNHQHPSTPIQHQSISTSLHVSPCHFFCSRGQIFHKANQCFSHFCRIQGFRLRHLSWQMTETEHDLGFLRGFR